MTEAEFAAIKDRWAWVNPARWGAVNMARSRQEIDSGQIASRHSGRKWCCPGAYVRIGAPCVQGIYLA